MCGDCRCSDYDYWAGAPPVPPNAVGVQAVVEETLEGKGMGGMSANKKVLAERRGRVLLRYYVVFTIYIFL